MSLGVPRAEPWRVASFRSEVGLVFLVADGAIYGIIERRGIERVPAGGRTES